MTRISNISEANQYLSRFYINTRDKYSLDNMRHLMNYLGNPQDKFKAVHIAGTSGKTSTAYYMSALLTAGGVKTGLTVSPHVDSLTERIQVNGQPLSEADFCEALSDFLNIIEQVSIKPSWFELMVSFAYWYFAREAVDYMIVEVGLGGLLDGTNVITRPDKVCLITDIGLDHTDILGQQLSEIASQKIGIAQPHNLVFTHEQAPEVMEVFKDYCAKQAAELHIVPTEAMPDSDIPSYQSRNWELAYAAYQTLQKRDNLQHLTDQALSVTRQIYIPGRMDIRQLNGKTVIMDGAHNAQKMTAFLDSFRQLHPGVKPAILIGLKEGKEYEDLIPLLGPLTDRLIITGFEANQDTPISSMDPEALAEAFRAAGKASEVITNPTKAYQALLASPEPVVIVTGSFYLLSQIRNNKPIA